MARTPNPKKVKPISWYVMVHSTEQRSYMLKLEERLKKLGVSISFKIESYADISTKHFDPFYAIEELKEQGLLLQYASMIVFLDRDTFPNDTNFDNTIKLMKDEYSRVHLAISNPSFVVWRLLQHLPLKNNSVTNLINFALLDTDSDDTVFKEGSFKEALNSSTKLSKVTPPSKAVPCTTVGTNLSQALNKIEEIYKLPLQKNI